jgi:HEAT repeat protein
MADMCKSKKGGSEMKTRSILLLALGLTAAALLGSATSCAKVAELLAGTEKEEDEETKKKEKADFDAQVKAFKDPATDAAAHNTALGKLRDMKKEECIPYLLAGLKDADKAIVLTAVRGLGTYSYLPPLDEDEREIDPEAREKAEKLKAATDRAALQPLLKIVEQVRSSDPKDINLRWWALWALKNIGTAEKIDETERQNRRAQMTPTLREMLQDPDRDVRVLALDTLVAIKNLEVIPDIVRALEDEDPNIRRRAAMALGELKVKDQTKVLVQALQEDKDIGVRTRAAQALSLLADPGTVGPLLAVLEESTAQVKQLQQALEAGGLTATPSSKKPEAEAGETAPLPPNLGGNRRGATQAVEELKQQLDDQTALRESAIFALSRINDPQARARIKELDDEEFAAAEKAIEEMEAERKKRL